MKYTENSLNILTAVSYKGIGRAWVIKRLKGNESEQRIVTLLNESLKDSITLENFLSTKKRIRTQLSDLEEYCDGLIAIGDENFPESRGNVKVSEHPIFLFYKGNLDLLKRDNKNISVIGLLNPTSEIEEREQNIVKELVEHNITIVSGLALGCDSIAHKQALKGGKTIAILPSPLHNILPAKNRDLAHKIANDGGLLITEYYENFKTQMELNSRYKERDRLQALFCDTIILVASYAQNSANRWSFLSGKKLDSGARLAMEYAKNYNIPRAVVYNHATDCDNPMFDLNRDLVKQGVTVLTPKSLTLIIEKIKFTPQNIL